MSAFVVSKDHIDAMLAAGLGRVEGVGPAYAGDGFHRLSWFSEWPEDFGSYAELHRELNFETVDETGQMLVDECVRSVSFRYYDSDDLPGPVDPYWVRAYVYERPRRQLTAVEVLKAVDCYVYQSCEHPGWRDSEAARFCDALRSKMIGCLPGYDAAAWEVDFGKVGV